MAAAEEQGSGNLTLDTQTDTHLAELNFDQLRQERFDRNRQFLQGVDAGVASKVLPQSADQSSLTPEELAAATIQRCWRGYKGRQIYVVKLYEKYEQEEEKIQVQVMQQMEEGDLLVENHQLEVLLDDGITTRRNARRRYLSKVITIQRAWRAYLDNKTQIPGNRTSTLGNHDNNTRSRSQHMTDKNGRRSFDNLEARAENAELKTDIRKFNEDCNFMINPLSEVTTSAAAIVVVDKAPVSGFPLECKQTFKQTPNSNQNNETGDSGAVNIKQNTQKLNQNNESCDTDSTKNNTQSLNENIETGVGTEDTQNLNQNNESVVGAKDTQNLNTQNLNTQNLNVNNRNAASNLDLSPQQMRKQYILSQAHKFVKLKEQDSSVLPFNLHVHLGQESGGITGQEPSVKSGEKSENSGQESVKKSGEKSVNSGQGSVKFGQTSSGQGGERIDEELSREVRMSADMAPSESKLDNRQGLSDASNSSGNVKSGTDTGSLGTDGKSKNSDTILDTKEGRELAECDNRTLNSGCEQSCDINKVNPNLSLKNPTEDGCVKCDENKSDEIQGGNSASENKGGDLVSENKGSNAGSEIKGVNSGMENKGGNSGKDNKGGNSVSEIKGSNSGSENKGDNVTVADGEEITAFDVYNIETALPYMDWANLEEKLKAASEEAKQIQEVLPPKMGTIIRVRKNTETQKIVSTVDDLNLDFSDRKWEDRPVNGARFPVEFKLHDTDSECSGHDSDADGEEEDEDTDDEYFFDHRLDFGHYIPKTNTVTDSESGGCHGDRTGDLDRNGDLDLGNVGGKVVGNIVPSGVGDNSTCNSMTGTSTGHVKPSQEEALVNGNLNMCNNTVTRSNDLDLEQKRKSGGQQNGLDDAMRTNVIREKDENRNDVKVMEIVNGVRAGLDIQRITELNGVKLDTLTSAVEKFSLAARRNDREEIRKKLAMGGEEDSYDDNDIDDDDDDDDVGYKKASLQSRLHSGLQICFMNESPGDTDNEGVSPRQHEIHDNSKLTLKHDSRVDSDNNLSTMEDLNNPGTLAGTSIQTTSPPRLKTDEQSNIATSEGNFQTRQEQLQNEAKLALAQAGSMAHMQLEIEKQTKKKSPMAEMAGIPGLGERRRKKLSPRQLQQMNLAQTQVLYNDLQTQIESLNEELVHLLMERDELHMEQDSMLVDIEDLTRRAEELADKANRDSRTKTCNAKGKLPSR